MTHIVVACLDRLTYDSKRIPNVSVLRKGQANGDVLEPLS